VSDTGTTPSELLGGLPVAELHVHVEGTLEPSLVRRLAARNRLPVPDGIVDAERHGYRFADLQEFLDVYYANLSVLTCAQDFYDLAQAYLVRARRAGVRRAEIFFDPQTHLERGVAFEDVVEGLSAAIDDEGDDGVSGALILCFLRHLGPDEAHRMLDVALASRDRFIGVGLDSSEVGFPPAPFDDVFRRAAAEDLHLVAHAGEEGDPSYVWEALDVLHVERIDHGIRAMEDARLVEELRERRVPLTVCPLSNVALQVTDRMSEHPLLRMAEAGLLVTVNSDDPAYFGGYVDDNLRAVQRELGADLGVCAQLARQSFEASFATAEQKAAWCQLVDAHVARSVRPPGAGPVPLDA
jgi:adenosine deaminase